MNQKINRTITITKTGMPNRELTLEMDTAEVLLDALAEVLGARVEYGWSEPEMDAEVGTIAITSNIDRKDQLRRLILDDVYDPSRVEGGHFVVEEPGTCPRCGRIIADVDGPDSESSQIMDVTDANAEWAGIDLCVECAEYLDPTDPLG